MNGDPCQSGQALLKCRDVNSTLYISDMENHIEKPTEFSLGALLLFAGSNILYL